MEKLSRGISVKLQKNTELKLVNWDDREVLSVSTKYVDYMFCEHWEGKDSGKSGK